MAANAAWYTRATIAKAKRRTARAAERERLRREDVELVLSGKRDEVLAEYGIDLLDHSRSHGSADGGQGRVAMGDMPPDPMRVSDYIRAVVNDPEREKERERLKRGGSHDAKDVPEDAPPPTSYPAVPWEQV